MLRLRLIKFKMAMFVMGVTCLTISSTIICIGLLEIYVNVKKSKPKENIWAYVDQHVIANFIFAFANIMIFVHMLYLVLHTLRGLFYTWYISCNYVMYIVSEMLSVIVLMTHFHDFRTPLILAILVISLAVILFFITFFAQTIFFLLERTHESETRSKFVIKKPEKPEKKKKADCVRISLHTGAVNQGAGPSGVRR